jgi:hypothetical protein
MGQLPATRMTALCSQERVHATAVSRASPPRTTSALEMIEPQLVLELRVLLFDRRALMSKLDETREGSAGGQTDK